MDPKPSEDQENMTSEYAACRIFGGKCMARAGYCDLLIVKGAPVAEREITALVKLYCEAREEFNRKFEGASKTGPSIKQMKLKEWAREISSLGVCERSEKQIEERLRADLKRVSKYAADMRKKYTGTGGGEGPQKPNVTGLAAIQCEEYDEQPTSSKAILKVKVEPKTPPRQPFHEVNEPRSTKSPSPLLLEEQQETRESAKPTEKTPKSGEGAATPATSKKSGTRKKSIAMRAKETMSVFTDRRSPLYDEEIRVAKLRAEVLEVDAERARVDLQRSRIELERAEIELRRVRLEMDRLVTDGRSRIEPSELYRTYTVLE
ncbi:hypothetical protein Aduo_007265 [Ancylostoma duodenale]